MFDESLFKNWNFIYENSEDVTLEVVTWMEGESEPHSKESFDAAYMKKTPQDKACHIDLFSSFELVIHAVKDDILYCSLMKQVAETGWINVQQFTLQKKMPRQSLALEIDGKKIGTAALNIKEWGGIKRGIIL